MNPGIETTDNKIIGELRDELKNLNSSLKEYKKSSDKVSNRMLLLVIIQVILAIYQLILMFADGTSLKLAIIGTAMVISIALMFEYGAKKIK